MRALFTLAVFAPSLLSAQGVRTLGKPDAEFAEPFTSIASIRVLRDGRVIVADSREKLVQAIDFAKGSAQKIGGEGNGPKEYAFPASLVDLPGDSTAIFDLLNRRFLLVRPDGTPGDFIQLAAATERGAVSYASPRYSDQQGRVYTLGPSFQFVNGQPVTADSVPILRFDRKKAKADTLGFLQVSSGKATASASSRTVVTSGATPFPARDEWVVLRDGRVGIVRTAPYRLDWIQPTKTQGAPIAFTSIRVTEAHKAQWRNQQNSQGGLLLTSSGGRVSTAAASGATFQVPEPTSWPEVLPPFLFGTVWVAPNGQIWVERTRAADDNIPKFDVLDASGKVVSRVHLAAGTSLIGFGPGTIYTIRRDGDDLQYLQRHKM